MPLQSLPETFSCKRLSMTIEVSHCKPHGLRVPPALDSFTPGALGSRISFLSSSFIFLKDTEIVAAECGEPLWLAGKGVARLPAFPRGVLARPEIPSRIAKGRAQGSRGGKPGTLPAISLHARGQGIVTYSICFFCVFFMGKYVWWSGWSGLRLTNLQIWVMWSTHPFDPNCFDAFDPFLIGPELIICCPMSRGLASSNPQEFSDHGCPLVPGFFSLKFHQLTVNSPKIPHRMVELPGHFSMLRRLKERDWTAAHHLQAAATFAVLLGWGPWESVFFSRCLFYSIVLHNHPMLARDIVTPSQIFFLMSCSFIFGKHTSGILTHTISFHSHLCIPSVLSTLSKRNSRETRSDKVKHRRVSAVGQHRSFLHVCQK